MTDMADMEMGGALPDWVGTASWIWIVSSVLSAAAVLFDIRARGHRQSEPFMAWIWPLAALYLGPLGLPVYLRFGRSRAGQPGQDPDRGAVRGVLSGGVASGIAHLVAVPFVVATGLAIAGTDMWAMVAIIAVLATGFIFAFDYVLAARQGRTPTVRGALVAAVLTVLAFDVGMLGWMLILYFTDTMPAAGDVRFTFLMQLGLIFGSLTALPLIRSFLAARTTQPTSPA